MAGLTKVKGSGLATGAATDSLVGIDDNATSTAITIDSSENVLVGTTTNSASVAGVTAGNSGLITACRSGNYSGIFSRLSSDGDIVQFRKDGTTVGSIGSEGNGGTFFIGSGDVTLGFNAASDIIIPRGTNAANRTDAIDLGNSSNRFKDLYLSGGVRLGGTGAANALDDYEEGTWTPVLIGQTTTGTPTYSIQTGNYTKVGNKVSVNARVGISARGGLGGQVRFTGLPFTAFGTYAVASFSWARGLNIVAGQSLTSHTAAGATSGDISIWDDVVGTDRLDAGQLSDNGEFMFSMTYLT